MQKIILGQFEVGQTVKIKTENAFSASRRRGTVIEISADRCRVQWEPQSNGVKAKKTWMNKKSLIQVITTTQPAVGSGGWLLNTDTD